MPQIVTWLTRFRIHFFLEKGLLLINKLGERLPRG